MSSLLEIKEVVKRIYSKYDTYIAPVFKFLIAFIAFICIKNQLGFMPRINNVAILLIAALVCSFLPVGFMIFLRRSLSCCTVMHWRWRQPLWCSVCFF